MLLINEVVLGVVWHFVIISGEGETKIFLISDVVYMDDPLHSYNADEKLRKPVANK